MDNFYVYIYFDKSVSGKFIYDDLEFQNLPIYVGKGKNLRHEHHIHTCFNPNNKKLYRRLLSRKIRKMINNKNYPKILIFKDKLSESDAFNLEIKLIKKIGRRVTKTGPLCNNSIGGEGASGSYHSKYKISVFNDKGELLRIEDSAKICIQKYKISIRTIYKHLSGKQLSSNNGFRFRKESDNIKKLKHINNIFINRRHKSIIQYDLNNNYISEFYSISEASRFLNITRSAIDNNLNGRSKTCNKFIFKYK